MMVLWECVCLLLWYVLYLFDWYCGGFVCIVMCCVFVWWCDINWWVMQFGWMRFVVFEKEGLMICIFEWWKVVLLCVVLVLLFVVGCGGGDDLGLIIVLQCLGSVCGLSGVDMMLFVVMKLCFDVFDYMMMYMGGVGSGEYVKVKFDMMKFIYQLQFIELLVLILVG